MLKKAMIAILGGLLLGVMSPFAAATSTDTGIATVARYFGDDYQFLVAVRTDDAYISDLNGVINRVLSNVPDDLKAGLPSEVDLRTFLADIPLNADNSTSYEEIRGFLGDYAAIGIRDYAALLDSGNNVPADAGLMVAIELTDKDAFVAFVENALPGLGDPVAAAAFDIYQLPDVTMAVAADVVMFAADNDTLPAVFTGLEATEAYMGVVGALPADNYNWLMYADYAAIFNAIPNMEQIFSPDMMQMLPQNLAMGLTILDETNLTIDVVGDVPESMMMGYLTPLTPEFEAFIPADTHLLARGSNIQAYIQNALTSLETTLDMQGTDAADFDKQLETVFAQIKGFTQLDVNEDVLSWMTGDYAIYSSIDTDTIIKILSNNRLIADLTTLPVEFGVVIATDDATATAKVVKNLSNLVKGAVANTKDVTIEDVNMDDMTGIEIQINVPVTGTEQSLSYDILLASNENVFFFGTTSVAEDLQAGSTISSDPTYNKALSYSLPNAIALLYTDDDGAADITSLFGVSILGPVIDNIFENIMSGMNGQTTRPLDDQYIQQTIQSYATAVNTARAIVDYSLIVSAVDGDYSIARILLALK